MTLPRPARYRRNELVGDIVGRIVRTFPDEFSTTRGGKIERLSVLAQLTAEVIATMTEKEEVFDKAVDIITLDAKTEYVKLMRETNSQWPSARPRRYKPND